MEHLREVDANDRIATRPTADARLASPTNSPGDPPTENKPVDFELFDDSNFQQLQAN